MELRNVNGTIIKTKVVTDVANLTNLIYTKLFSNLSQNQKFTITAWSRNDQGNGEKTTVSFSTPATVVTTTSSTTTAEPRSQVCVTVNVFNLGVQILSTDFCILTPCTTTSTTTDGPPPPPTTTG